MFTYCDVPTPPRDLVSTSVTRGLQSFPLVLTINVIRIYTSSKIISSVSPCVSRAGAVSYSPTDESGWRSQDETHLFFSSSIPKSQSTCPTQFTPLRRNPAGLRARRYVGGDGARTPEIVIVLTPSPPST